MIRLDKTHDIQGSSGNQIESVATSHRFHVDLGGEENWLLRGTVSCGAGDQDAGDPKPSSCFMLSTNSHSQLSILKAMLV